MPSGLVELERLASEEKIGAHQILVGRLNRATDKLEYHVENKPGYETRQARSYRPSPLLGRPDDQDFAIELLRLRRDADALQRRPRRRTI